MSQLRDELTSIRPDAVLVLPQQGGGNLRFWINRLIFLRRSGFRGPVFGWRTSKFIEEAARSLKLGTAIHASEFPNYAVCDLLNIDYSLVRKELFNLAETARAPREPVFSKATQSKIDQWLRAKHRIAISIGAMQEHKQWPLAHFSALVGRLIEHYDAAVVLLGTKEYVQPGDDIAGRYPRNLVNLCGSTNVGQLAYIIKNSQICVANDGGTTHLASALGIPTVALMPGIEPPGSVDPYGWDKFSVRHKIDCAPCYSFLNCPKGHRQCMLAIPVDHVFQKIVSIFNEYIYIKV